MGSWSLEKLWEGGGGSGFLCLVVLIMANLEILGNEVLRVIKKLNIMLSTKLANIKTILSSGNYKKEGDCFGRLRERKLIWLACVQLLLLPFVTQFGSKLNRDFIKKPALKYCEKTVLKNFKKFLKMLKSTTTFDVFERPHYEVLPLDKLT